MPSTFESTSCECCTTGTATATSTGSGNATGCALCTGGVIPKRLQLVVTTVDTTACWPQYAGTYILHLIAPYTSCLWRSDELPIDITSGTACPEWNGVGLCTNRYRWQAYLTSWSAFTPWNFQITGAIWNGSCVQTIGGQGTQDTPTTVRNCLVAPPAIGLTYGARTGTGVISILP
jgi:hypothetical protein